MANPSEPIRLIVRPRAGLSGIPGDVGYVLFDGDGRMLPGQRAVSIFQRTRECTIVRVEFVVAPDEVMMDDRETESGALKIGAAK